MMCVSSKNTAGPASRDHSTGLLFLQQELKEQNRYEAFKKKNVKKLEGRRF
jgi:hypothetical protein